jgi:DNA-directed RNA polymerase specialized sigma24 family protein
MTDREIEDILRDYPVIKAQATIKQENLYNLFPSVTAVWSDMPHGHDTSDSTGNIAVKRMSEPLEVKQSRAIEIACNALTSDCRELVKLYYFEKWRRGTVIYDKMHISENVFKQYRREALDKIGKILETTYKQPQNNHISV